MLSHRWLSLVCAMLPILLMVSIGASQPDFGPEKHISIGISELPCGVGAPSSNSSHLRIVGGVEAELGEYPWMVSIHDEHFDPRWLPWGISVPIWGHICGGVIIGDRHILTAAHCLQYDQKINEKLGKFYIGDYNLAQADGERSVAIERVIYATKLDPESGRHDIALVKTKQPMKFSLTKERIGSVNRICLPLVESHANFKSKHGLRVTVAGWGATETVPTSDKLMKVDATIAQCVNPPMRIGNETICTSDAVAMGGHCHGDSGGPLMARLANPGQFVLAGIVQRGPRECVTNPGHLDRHYAEVNYYMPWILRSIFNDDS